MSELRSEDTMPVFAAYGAACFWSQHLERTIKLFLLISKHQETNKQTDNIVLAPLDSKDALKTLGDLFREARDKEYFTEAERKKINNSIRDRNILIHSYWDKHLEIMNKPEGRHQVCRHLDEIQEMLKSSTEIINSLIDKKLEEYGLSLEEISSIASQEWESGLSVTEKLLH